MYKHINELDLAQHRYLSVFMLVQSSSILEFVEIAMAVFDFTLFKQCTPGKHTVMRAITQLST